MHLDKAQIRKYYRDQRRAMHRLEKAKLARQTCSILGDLIDQLGAKTVHTFIPLEEEVDITPLIGCLLNAGIVVVVPQTLAPPRLDHWVLKDLTTLSTGRFETQYPTNTARFTGDPDVVLVPGLVFDLTGHRIGYGAGYYDHFLAETKAIRVGVAFPGQITKELLPRETHDVPMDFLVSDKLWKIELSRRGT